jgi:hypothetical protein
VNEERRVKKEKGKEKREKRREKNRTWTHQCITSCILIVSLFGLLTVIGCGVFEPREPEAPSQSGLNYRPPTDPTIVIANLQNAIDQKSIANYMSCFTDPVRTSQQFAFIPASDALALYGGVLQRWTLTEEQAYFQNLVARSPGNAFSSLTLQLESSSVSADSVIYSYNYALVFEHSDPSFPRTAKGITWFTLRPDNNNFWAIQRWTDFTTPNAVSWSHFKGKFSN